MNHNIHNFNYGKPISGDKLTLKTLIGDYDIRIIEYDDYFVNPPNVLDIDYGYLFSRHINFDFYVYGTYLKPRVVDSTVKSGDLFDFDVRFHYSKSSFIYTINFYFELSEPNYVGFNFGSILKNNT